MNLNYKTSKDYALLKKLLDEGNQVVCIRNIVYKDSENRSYQQDLPEVYPEYPKQAKGLYLAIHEAEHPRG